MNKEEYQKLCEEAENARIYDGRGTIDLYQCDNNPNHKIYTTYADKGVTPFVIRCPVCGSWMSHTSTTKSVPGWIKVLKWVRPTYEEYCKLAPALKEHVEDFGLVMDMNE